MDIARHTEETEYEMMLNHLIFRSRQEGFSIQEVEDEFHHLLVYQGHGWVGRSETKEAEIQGHVYAYQIFLKRYKEGTLPVNET
ncbi:MAG: hypothetical protein JXK93_05885 [Sphaerochaetaceae bacterium]|nr:hypothetical protein [Sphaerochaetaceae bacterium]